MFTIQAKLKPSLFEAISMIALIIAIICTSIIRFQTSPHIPILCSIVLLIGYGLIKKLSYKDLESAMLDGAKSGIAAIYIFILIGILISSWLISGTIPTILYGGLAIVTASFFYTIVFVIAAIIGTAIGSSLTTVATVGIAFMTIAQTVDASLAITAGAIVSGAFFGDKMSPLSDTTTLAASVAGIDLFEHIKNMGWTTIPAFIISAILYSFLSPSMTTIDTNAIATYQGVLIDLNLVHWYSLLPLFVLIACTMLKVPTLLTLTISSIVGVFLAPLHTNLQVSDYINILYGGFSSASGNEVIDSLLTRGGMSSMYFTIGLVILSLSLGGLLFVLGIIERLLKAVESLLQSIGAAVTGAALTAISINTLIGEQYLSILLTGETFKAKFAQLNLHPKNLARVTEDAGTVINPLVPWSVCGLFISGMLGVDVLDYLPFAFFCLLSPILTITFGWLGWTMTKIERG
ncbi:MAG: Na+/H+ antiporter NhaC [Lysinibacillus sp.]